MKDWATVASAVIAGLALLVSSVALMRSINGSALTAWNICLQRLGQIYDAAMADDELAVLVVEAQGGVHRKTVTLKQDVWLASFFMALEQVYVASMTLEDENRMPWERYIINQLRKPTANYHFQLDYGSNHDFHPEFVRFCLANGLLAGFVSASGTAEAAQADGPLAMRSYSGSDNDKQYWREIYEDAEVKRQMYSTPITELLDKGKMEGVSANIVIDNGDRVGVFTVTRSRDNPSVGSIGIVIPRALRRRHYALRILTELAEKTAKGMGISTLRADVYRDNIASRVLLERAGYREFVWLEKNI